MIDSSATVWDTPSLPLKSLLQCAAHFERLRCRSQEEVLSDVVKEALGMDPALAGPWAGEFRVVLGELIMSNNCGDLQVAQHLFSDAAEWVKIQKNISQPNPQWVIPDYMKEATAPPASKYTSSGWGNCGLSVPSPGAILNQFTCPWYLDMVEINADVRLALCQFIYGDLKSAVASLVAIEDLDPRDAKVTQSGMGSNYRRLVDDLRSGGLFATKEELTFFPTNLIPELLLAELDHEMEQWPQAESKYHRFLRRHGESLNSNARAYLYLPLYMCRAYQGDRNGAEQLLREMIAKFPLAYSIPRAELELASVTTSSAEQIHLMRSIISQYPGSEWTVKAYFTLATYLEQEKKYDESINVIQALLKANHESDIEAQARNFLSSLNNFRSGNVEHIP